MQVPLVTRDEMPSLRHKKLLLKGVSTLAKWSELVEGGGSGGWGIDVRNFCRGLRCSFGAYNLGNLIGRTGRCYEAWNGEWWSCSVALARLVAGVVKVIRWVIELELPHLKMHLVPLVLIVRGCGMYKEVSGMVRRVRNFDWTWMKALYFAKKISATALHLICIVGVFVGSALAEPVTLVLATVALVASVALYLIKQLTQEKIKWQL
ncbi:MAG: hypothetical protein KBC64_04380 [Simkaniaceae bacterium]|nr:hypothetical protein [Simkaniaceae bacterium]